MRAAQTELFPSPQGDLFGADPAPRVHVPRREHILSPLNEIMATLRGAETWPWGEVQKDLKINRVIPHLLGHLPPDEADQWRADLDAEIARLDTAPIT